MFHLKSLPSTISFRELFFWHKGLNVSVSVLSFYPSTVLSYASAFFTIWGSMEINNIKYIRFCTESEVERDRRERGEKGREKLWD